MIDEQIKIEMDTYSPIGYLWVKFVMRSWHGTPEFGFETLGLKQFLSKVQRLIEETSEVDCLLSRFRYVREYRKWYDDKRKVR